MAKLRHQTFFSLAELNHCISALLTELNQKPFKQMPGSRQQWFETLDQPALSPLPKYAYQYTDIKTARVNIDYHLIYDQHLYSVPHHCVGEQVELHAGDKLIEVYFHNKRIATHVRKYLSRHDHRARAHAGTACSASAMDARTVNELGAIDRA